MAQSHYAPLPFHFWFSQFPNKRGGHPAVSPCISYRDRARWRVNVVLEPVHSTCEELIISISSILHGEWWPVGSLESAIVRAHYLLGIHYMLGPLTRGYQGARHSTESDLNTSLSPAFTPASGALTNPESQMQTGNDWTLISARGRKVSIIFDTL